MQQQVQGKTSYPLLDAIRGVAALVVVLYHIPSYLGFHPVRGYLAVDLFFILSGVVVANAYERKLCSTMSLGQFIYIRVVRLYPLYLLGLILGLAGTLLVSNVYMEGMGAGLALLLGLFMVPRFWPLRGEGGDNLSLFPLNGPSWSLFFELGVNFAYAWGVRYLTTRRVALIALLSGALMVAIGLTTASHSLNVGFRPRQIPLGFIRTCFSFSIGVLIFRHMDILGRLTAHLPRWPTTVAILALVFASLMFGPGKEAGVAYDLICVLLLFPAIVICALQPSYAPGTTRAFAFAGMSSYSIYVLHIPCYMLAQALTERLGLKPVVPLYGIALTLAVILLSYLADRFYDAPLRGYLRGLGKGKKAAAIKDQAPLLPASRLTES